MGFAPLRFAARQKGKFCLNRLPRVYLPHYIHVTSSLCDRLVMDQPPRHTITTAGALAVHISRSCRAVLNDAVEFDQQTRAEEHRRVAKRKHDEYDLAVLAAAVPYSGS